MTVLKEDDGVLFLAQPDESDGEDSSSLSLSDLVMLTPDGSDGRDRRSTPPPEFFFHVLPAAAADEMCAADEVFVRGRLIPSNPTRPPRRGESGQNPPVRRHCRSESLDAVGRGRAMAEYRRLRRASSESDPPPAKPRPRWYLFAFGSVRVPAAMEMKDIRARQSRWRPPAPAEVEGGGWGCEAGRCGGPWRLIRSLSCKAAESAAAAGEGRNSHYLRNYPRVPPGSRGHYGHRGHLKGVWMTAGWQMGTLFPATGRGN